MRQYERNGVTVDQCSQCRGIFLDRGELERLIDAENSWYARPEQVAGHPRSGIPPVAASQSGRAQQYRENDSDEYLQYGHAGHGRPKRRGGFLSELFD